MKNLFGIDLPVVNDNKSGERIAVRQYKQLISIYGKTEGKKCKDCINCEKHQGGSKTFYKCALAHISNSQATDWNSRWAACGQFKK
jgi:hypothetical protein